MNTYIIRCGEVALKGMNKPYFEKMLQDKIRARLKRLSLNDIKLQRREGLIFLYDYANHDEEQIISAVSKVFGVSSISKAIEVASELEEIKSAAVTYMKGLIEKRGAFTFKAEAKRADKTFPIKSPELSRMVGAAVLKGCKVLSVDVHEPQVRLFINVRKDKTYIYEDKISAIGGLPLGTNGKGMVLLSGGIDSPVAAFMMARRGMLIDAVHFHSYPYTSPRAQQKVEELAELVSDYCGKINMYIINLLPIQEAIVKNCPAEETTILVRRFMMRIAQKVAEANDALMLITGENLGQVASQTAQAIVASDSVVSMPVMRPLISMDKVEIMEIAKDIGTYDKSIEPYEDCCTVFLPKHPVTKPKLENLEKSESRLDVEALIKQALESCEVKTIHPKSVVM